MTTIDALSNLIMDLYYQENKSDDDFFGLSHFKMLAGLCYGRILQEEFNNSRSISRDDEVGKMNAFVSEDWQTFENISIEIGKSGFYEAILKFNVFDFQYDFSSTGLSDVIFDKKATFVKTTLAKSKMIAYEPVNDNIYGMVYNKNTIRFMNVNGRIKSAVAVYIPAPPSGEDGDDANIVIADGVGDMIREIVLKVMIDLKKAGIPIDSTADQNSNKTLETEISSILQKLKP